MANKTETKIKSVPQTIFEQFLKELAAKKVPQEVIDRLKKTLVDEPQVSVDALKEALFSNDNSSV